MERFTEKVHFIWSVADLLRGDYKQSEYGRVILPFTVLRRLDQVLAPTTGAVRDAAAEHAGAPDDLRHQILLQAAGQSFYNTSKLDFATLLADPEHLAQNLAGYVAGLPANARAIHGPLPDSGREAGEARLATPGADKPECAQRQCVELRAER